MSLFSKIRIPKLKRSRFNLSHDVKLSMRMGELTPIFCQPVIPGDSWKLNTEILMRFSPLIAPVMHRLNVYTHFFFVPNRLIWDNWKDFITGGEDGLQSPSYPRFKFPNVSSLSSFKTGTLADYLGFPVMDDGNSGDNRFNFGSKPFSPFEIDALPFRAYGLIWNEYYRDQNLTEELDIMKDSDGVYTLPIGSGAVHPLLRLRNRCWTKDYFTSALPFPQRGADVELPLTGDASFFQKSSQNPLNLEWASQMSTGASNVGVPGGVGYPPNGTVSVKDSELVVGDKPIHVSSPGSFLEADHMNRYIGVDMSKVSSATINELRRAVAAQQYLEAEARGGSRYIEYLLSVFGVKSSDARLQRPEYLGGGKQPVVISDVMQTSETTASSPQASPAGTAASLGKTHSFKRYFEEHGYIIGIMSVLPVPCYQQGMPRVFTKFDRFDYYIPQFAHLGEQEIKSSELYFDPATSGNDSLFGYSPRYSEYKYIPSSVHGDFRTSLKYWHMGRIFDSRPGLNYNFMESDPTTRIFAVDDTDTDKLWVNIHHNCSSLRPMPQYGTPKF